MRKRVLATNYRAPSRLPSGELDIMANATVLVTSEATTHPIDNAFDRRRGLGASRWLAADPGPQAVIIAFDFPQPICQVMLEIEEPEVSRLQELQMSLSYDGGRHYRDLFRKQYAFSPPRTTFECEQWAFTAKGVTHLRLLIWPDTGGGPGRATLTSWAVYGDPFEAEGLI